MVKSNPDLEDFDEDEDEMDAEIEFKPDAIATLEELVQDVVERLRPPVLYSDMSEDEQVESHQSQWSDWTDWSVCDVTCGEGHRHRSRICFPPSKACTGSKVKSEKCPDLPDCSSVEGVDVDEIFHVEEIDNLLDDINRESSHFLIS